jgi:hypothetical protein
MAIEVSNEEMPRPQCLQHSKQDKRKQEISFAKFQKRQKNLSSVDR